MSRYFLFIIIYLSSLIAFSQTPSFEDISDSDLDTIVKEFSTAFVHTTATPPTSLGKTFGVEAGILVGASESPGIEAISQRVDPNSEIQYMPHLWLIGGVSVPFGISVELNILPELEVEGLKMSHLSTGLKWSVTDQFLKDLPFDLAIRTYYTRSEISYEDTVSDANFPLTTNINVAFENTMIGGDTLFGVDAGLVEPYLGIGYVNTEGKLSGRSSTGTPYSLFDDQISSEKSSTQDSVRLIAGASFHLTAFNVSVEYTNVFSTHRLSLKTGLQF